MPSPPSFVVFIPLHCSPPICRSATHHRRREAVVSMEHENAFSTGPVRCVSASTYLRLRFLDAHTVSEEVCGWSGSCCASAAAVHRGGRMLTLPSHRMPRAALHCGPLTLRFVYMCRSFTAIRFILPCPASFECSLASTCRARSSANCCTGASRRCCVGFVWAHCAALCTFVMCSLLNTTARSGGAGLFQQNHTKCSACLCAGAVQRHAVSLVRFQRLGVFLTKPHAAAACRRDYILHYFDDLVATQGYSATVRE